MTQRKKTPRFFSKEDAIEWLKHPFLDLSSEQGGLLLRETRGIPGGVLRAFNEIFSEILLKLREFHSFLYFLEFDVGGSLQEQSLEYFWSTHDHYSVIRANTKEID